MQIIHQDPYASLNPTHTIYDILSFPLFRHKLARNRAEARARVVELLEMVDLTPAVDLIDKYPHQLSGGQRQRVSIARALTTNPSVIIADEAVSMVDVSIRMGILNMMMDMRVNLNVTIVFITHDLALAKYFAWKGRIAVMYLGRVVEIGETKEIIANPQHPYTKVLLSAIPEADPNRTRNKVAHPTAQRGHPAPDRTAARLLVPSALPVVRRRASAIREIPVLKQVARREKRCRGRLHSAHGRRRSETVLMNPDALRAFFRSGVFIAGLALVLMLMLPRDSAEFVISTCSLMLGLLLIAGVGLVVLLTRH